MHGVEGSICNRGMVIISVQRSGFDGDPSSDLSLHEILPSGQRTGSSEYRHLVNIDISSTTSIILPRCLKLVLLSEYVPAKAQKSSPSSLLDHPYGVAPTESANSR